MAVMPSPSLPLSGARSAGSALKMRWKTTGSLGAIWHYQHPMGMVMIREAGRLDRGAGVGGAWVPGVKGPSQKT